MQIRYYTRVIQRWFWLLLLSTLLCAGVTYVISQHMPPVYQASTLLQVNAINTADSGSVFANQALAVSYALLINSNDVLQQVAQRVPGENLMMLQANVSASPEENTQIIQIRANADTPQKAALVANTVAQVFITLQVQKASSPQQNLSTQLAHLLAVQKAQIDSDEGQLIALQNANAAADQLSRQRDKVSSDQTNYNATLTNYQQIQLQLLNAENIISQVQIATPPDSASSPHVLLNTLVAAALGLLLAITLAFLLDWLDTTIKTPEDVARRTSLTALGSIMLAKHPLLSEDQLLTNFYAEKSIERDFITLSTSLCTLSEQQKQHTLLITALCREVGVTTTAVYLSLALAQMGKRVLLVDANMRNPMLHQIFHAQNIRGLVNSLSEVYHFREGIAQQWLNQWSTGIANFWVLPTGPVSTHPATILGSQELSLLIAWLSGLQDGTSELLDFILFDAPALNDYADTLALASITTETVLVIEAGKEREETLMATEAMLKRMGAAIFGVVVNRQTSHHYPSIYTREQTHQVEKQPHTGALAIAYTGAKKQRISLDTPPIEVQSVGSRLFSKEKEKRRVVPAAYTVSQAIQPIPANSELSAQSTPSLFKNRQFIR